MRRILALASSVLFLPALSLAQHHGGMIPAGHVAAAPPHIIVAPVQAGSAHVASGVRVAPAPVMVHRTRVVNGTARRGGNIVFSTPVFASDLASAPGLGFDFAHMAAINSGRVRHQHFVGQFPFGFSGFLLTSPSVIVEEAPAEQPVVEEEVVAENPNEVVRERRRIPEARESPAVSEAPAPQQDAPEYVFVRRDGGLVFAVAYSWDNGTLRYITREGLRGSVMQGALDMEATQQFNDQRGVNFRSPV